MLKRAAYIVAALVVLVIGYLLLWPVPIEPVAWQPPPAPALEGPYAPNDLLSGASRLLEGIGIGPEDVAFDQEGRLYTGFIDGRIVRTPPNGGAVESFAGTGGRPLGMVFDDTGNLIVADAVQGLLSIAPDGTMATLATETEGIPFKFLDDLDIGPDGTIYVSDASTKFGYGEDVLDIMEHGGHGRLIANDPVSGTARVLLDGLQFANGVAMARDGESVLVAETGAYRIMRYWLSGERSGTAEVFIDNLPGFPDNINMTGDGTLWVALPTPRLPDVDKLAGSPFWRKLIIRLPEVLHPAPLRYGLVLAIDESGQVTRSLHDQSGTVALVTSVMEHKGHLYLGSYMEPSIAVVPISSS
jgi:sugar lactone lactonase YvrE